MAILRVKDENGNIIEIPAIKGDKGEKGDPYILTDVDKQEIVNEVESYFDGIVETALGGEY